MMTIDKIDNSFCISGIWDGVLHDGTVYFPMNKTAVKIDKKDIVYFMDAWSHDELFATPLRLLQYHGEYLTRETLHTVFDEIASVKESKKVDENWFRIENLEDSEATFTVPSHGKIAFSAEISIDGETWSMTQFGANSTATIPANGTLFFRNGDLNIKYEGSVIYGLSCNKRHAVSGNMKHICKRVMGTPHFFSMFEYDSNLVGLSKLVIPWKKLRDDMFSYTFYLCTSLEKAPELPATTLASYCYDCMFGWCSSLEKAPELPATTLASYCYCNMFSDCSSLTQAPELPATTLADMCYNFMFIGCTSLTRAPELPATTLAASCYYYMFGGCTSLTQAPELPATTLANSCYNNMFYGCTSLEKAPELPATTLATSCYKNMFYGCTSLTQAPELPATTLATSCYNNMFNDCPLTQAPELPATTLARQCYDGMFTSCTSLTQAPELPATTLANSCYNFMFGWCSSLEKAPELPATTLADGCYKYMFSSCRSLTQAPELPATTLANGCYYGLFNGCSSLTQAPELPATTLAESCYYDMFANCSSLSSIKCLATDISADNATTDWVKNVSSSGTFTCASGMSLTWTVGNSGIPTGWEVEDPGKKEFFTITNETDSAGTVTLTMTGSPNQISLKVSSDSGSTWDEYSNLSATTTFTLPASGSLMFDGSTNNTWTTDLSNRWTFKADVKHSVSGSLYTLVGPAELVECEFWGFFYDDSLLVDSSKLKLPWTTLATSCYSYMFNGCTGLTQAPELPATALPLSCYNTMFGSCSSLTQAPKLPATALAHYCYSYMFSGCTSLTQAPELPATTLATSCYNSMFKGCKSLTQAPSLPATTLVTECYYSMFYNCTKLTKITCLITDFTVSNALKRFVTGSSSGTLTCASGTADTWATLKTSQSCVPEGWTIVEAS